MREDGGRRAVVTGMGAVSSLGFSASAVVASIRAGRSGIRPIREFDASGFERTLAGEVPDFDPRCHLVGTDPARWGRSGQFAAAAARMAVSDAVLDPVQLSTARTASCFGTTNGESQTLEDLSVEWGPHGSRPLSPDLVGQADAGRIATAVSSELNLAGEALTFGTACAASNYAIGYGFDLVRTGEVDAVICGGADASNRATHAGFHRLGALAQDVPRPFDRDRDGIVTAEGGVALVLEPLELAVARKARIYAEVLGYGMTCDAKHMTNPDAASIAECIRAAHIDAGIDAGEVDYICAHGTGTRANDSTEVAAVRAVFTDGLPPMSSIKSMLGHTMGAAAGFGALVSCAALYEGFLPPSATLRELDPELGADLDCVPGTGRPAHPRVVENHGFAFGGNNAVTIFRQVAA